MITVLVMTVLATIVFVVSLLFFIVFTVMFLFHINAAISFHIVWPATVDMDVDVRRRRLIVTDADIHIIGAPISAEKAALASFVPKVMAAAVSISKGRIIFFRITAPFQLAVMSKPVKKLLHNTFAPSLQNGRFSWFGKFITNR